MVPLAMKLGWEEMSDVVVQDRKMREDRVPRLGRGPGGGCL